MATLVLGIDVGKRNLPFSFLDPETRDVKYALKIDLKVWNGREHEIGYEHIGRVISEWLNRLSEWFELTREVGIEEQPLGVGLPIMHVIQAHLESGIRQRFPHLKVRLVNPKRVRAFFGTGGGDYKTRKRKSVEVGTFSESDMKRVKRTFKKVDDVVEASQIALYVATHPEDEDTVVKWSPTTSPSGIVMQGAILNLPSQTTTTTCPKKRKKRIEEVDGEERSKTKKRRKE